MARSFSYRPYLPPLVMAALLVFPAVASAAEPAEPRPCMDELERFCRDVQPGEGRIIKCLQEHDRNLSPVCRDKIQNILKRLDEAKQACAPDIEKFCADVIPGGGRLIKCLKPHFGELTPACREKAGPVLKQVEKAQQPVSYRRSPQENGNHTSTPNGG